MDRPALNFDDVWNIYLRCAHWYPPAPAPVTPRWVPNLLALADEADVFLFDSFGVLNRGEDIIGQAPQVIKDLRRLGKVVHVVSNNSSDDKALVHQGLLKKGFDFTLEEVTTSMDAVEPHLEDLSAPKAWGLIAGERRPLAHLTGSMLDAAVHPQGLESVDGVVFLSALRWDPQQPHLHSAMAQKKRPVLVGNPDVAAPVGDVLRPAPGYYVHRLWEETGVIPVLEGKPMPRIFELALARYPGVAKERVLMIGDTLHTDILGARALGLKALLVESGVLLGRDVLPYCAESGIWPDFIAPSIG